MIIFIITFIVIFTIITVFKTSFGFGVCKNSPTLICGEIQGYLQMAHARRVWLWPSGFRFKIVGHNSSKFRSFTELCYSLRNSRSCRPVAWRVKRWSCLACVNLRVSCCKGRTKVQTEVDTLDLASFKFLYTALRPRISTAPFCFFWNSRSICLNDCWRKHMNWTVLNCTPFVKFYFSAVFSTKYAC